MGKLKACPACIAGKVTAEQEARVKAGFEALKIAEDLVDYVYGGHLAHDVVNVIGKRFPAEGRPDLSEVLNEETDQEEDQGGVQAG